MRLNRSLKPLLPRHSGESRNPVRFSKWIVAFLTVRQVNVIPYECINHENVGGAVPESLPVRGIDIRQSLL